MNVNTVFSMVYSDRRVGQPAATLDPLTLKQVLSSTCYFRHAEKTDPVENYSQNAKLRKAKISMTYRQQKYR